MLIILYLLISISTLYMQEHFILDIEETGESTLFIFQDSITSLQIGDELGLFDDNGMLDSSGNIGELLVGSGVWQGSQLSIAAISSQDLSLFGGPILPGYTLGNSMKLKIWNHISNIELESDYILGAGSGTFNGLFSVINNIGCADIPVGNCDCDGNVEDGCGICDGPGSIYECGCEDIPDGDCDCDGNVEDCAGDCGGSATTDECGVCGGNGIADGACDCNGNIDLGCGCGLEGPSGCDNTCGSNLEYDECGECGGNGPTPGFDCLDNCIIGEDCFGVCGGSATLDECGVCDGPGAAYYCDWPYYYYVCSAEDCDGGGTGDTGGGATGGWDGEINYESEIQPIFETNCTECHSSGGGYFGGLDLTSYSHLMEGGNSGETVFPYYSSASLLIEKLNGTAGTQMPPNADPLDNETISLIAAWIDQGAIGPDDDSEGGGCNPGEIEDCNGDCFDENLLENGECNNGIDGGADFNCSSLYFDGDCLNNFDNCSPDCPVGILEFGNIDIGLSGGSIVGQLEIIMNCQFDVSEFEITLSDGINIIEIASGTALDNNFELNFSGNLVSAIGGDSSLISGEQSILVLDFNTTSDRICFDDSNITTSIGIEYAADLGECVPLGSYPSGWNWISINQSFDDMSLNSTLSSIDGNAEFIKNQSGYADYYDGFGWFGTLEQIDNVSMYKLRMINDDAIAYRGNIINVDDVVLSTSNGWNWIGYVPYEELDINIALNNIPAGNAEFIKSQSGYADYYNDFGWFGTLANMKPLNGYLLRMIEDTDFTYSLGGMARTSSTLDVSFNDFDLNIHDYEHNATMTSALYIDDSRVDSYDYVLSAYNDSKCVGYTEGLYFPLDGNIIFPLMVYGNEAGSMLTFKIYNKTTQTYLEIDEEFVFTPDMTLGDGFNPVVLNSTETPAGYSISAAYPNPFNPVVNFDIELDGEHYVEARVYNISGQQVGIIYDGMLSGSNKLNWMASNQASGIYFIKVAVDGVLETSNKIILLK